MEKTTTRSLPCTREPIAHGDECECMALAAAMQLDKAAISFTFCHSMLQRRWAMRCRHGSSPETVDLIPSDERWRQHEQITPVLAILLENA